MPRPSATEEGNIYMALAVAAGRSHPAGGSISQCAEGACWPHGIRCLSTLRLPGAGAGARSQGRSWVPSCFLRVCGCVCECTHGCAGLYVHTMCVWTMRVDALGVCVHVCIYRQCIYINRWPNGCSWSPKPLRLLWVESTPGVAHLACCFKIAQTRGSQPSSISGPPGGA